jgi:hypothetical protein
MITRGEDLILPLRHKIKQEKIASHYPLIAPRLSRSSDMGVDILSDDVVRLLGTNREENYKQNYELATNNNNKTIYLEKGKNSEAKISHKELQRISTEDLRSCISKVNSTNHALREHGWSRLQNLALTKIIWNSKEIWQVLDKVLLDSSTEYLGEALMTLKGMLLTASEDTKSSVNEVSSRTNDHYKGRMVEIFESPNDIWMKHKSDCKQILGYITSEEEKFYIYWRAWRRAAIEVINDDEYTASIASVINELPSSKEEYKNRIEQELSDMMESSDARVANRAQQMYHELFE